MQGIRFHNPGTNFAEILKETLPFLRAASLGDILLLAGHAAFVLNITGLVYRSYRVRAVRAYAAATATISAEGVQP